MVDDFTTFQFLSQSGVGSTSDVTSGAGIVGTERDMTLTVTAGPGVAQLFAGTGEFAHSCPASVSATSILTWDGIDGTSSLNPIGLGGVDMTDGGLSAALRLRVSHCDLPANIQFNVYGATGSSTGTISVPPSTGTPIDYALPYSSFTVISGAGADFANVGAIQMTIAGSPALDLSLIVIDTIAIPEPTTLAAIGALSVIALRRR